MIILLLLLVGSYLFYYFTGNIVLFLILICASIGIVLWGGQLGLSSAKHEVSKALGNIEDGYQKRHDVLVKVLDAVRSELSKREASSKKMWELIHEKREMPKGLFGQSTAKNEYERWYVEIRKEVVNYMTQSNEMDAKSHGLLIRSINDVEENLSAARRFFNHAVKEYNEKLEGFPTNLIAKAKRYEPMAFFAVENEEIRKDIEIKL